MRMGGVEARPDNVGRLGPCGATGEPDPHMTIDRGSHMRTLRLATALSVTIFMALATTAGAAAQAEACTGVIELGTAEGEAMTWSATDPRLSGAVEVGTDWSLYEPASEDAAAGPVAAPGGLVITNDGGSWGCVASEPGGPEPDVETHTLVFQGAGDYEGLTAHVQVDWDAYPYLFSGVILEGDPLPDPELAG
jgi:hypothetical protein